MEDPLERSLWEFPAPPYGGLLDIGAKLFIFESGLRIGLGEVIAQNDDAMLVEIRFTAKPRLNELYYGLISDMAGLGEGQ